MKKLISFIEILLASLIILGGINVFYSLNIWLIDSQLFADFAAGAIIVYAVLIFFRKRVKLESKSVVS